MRYDRSKFLSIAVSVQGIGCPGFYYFEKNIGPELTSN